MKNRKTNVDSVMEFLNPYLKQKHCSKTTRKIGKAAKNIFDDSQLLTKAPTAVDPVDNVCSDNSTYATIPKDKELHVPSKKKSPDDFFDLTDEEAQLFLNDLEGEKENCADLQKAAKNNETKSKEPDSYHLAIRKAFSNELKEEMKLNAMLHLCQKLKDFKLSRETVDF